MNSHCKDSWRELF